MDSKRGRYGGYFLKMPVEATLSGTSMVRLDLPDESARAYALKTASQAAAWSQDEQIPADFPASLVDVLEIWLFETEPQGSLDQNRYGIWLHSGSGGIEAACEFIQHLQRKFKLPDVVSFEWSFDCTKPRVDAYGGGAAIITARRIISMTTAEWLGKQTARLRQKDRRRGQSVSRTEHPTH